jgi:Contractile injection system tube protein
MTDSKVLEKARLEPVPGETATPIEFMFNPTELKFSRSVAIDQAPGATTKKGQNQTSFKHPNPYQLTISNIILDTYEKLHGNEGEERNVLKHLKPFTDAVAYVKEAANTQAKKTVQVKGTTKTQGAKAKRPPIYLFTWGKNSYLRCFIKSCNFRLTMFLPNGTPVRAIIDLTLEQVDNPKSEPSQSTPSVGKAQREGGGRTLPGEKSPLFE